jgi:hypothetical protein
LNAEIEALRVAARILEGGAGSVPEAARPVAVQSTANGGDKTKRVWP